MKQFLECDIHKSSWISARRLPQLRLLIRLRCDTDAAREALASLRGRRRGGYLANILGHHPDAKRAVWQLTDAAE